MVLVQVMESGAELLDDGVQRSEDLVRHLSRMLCL
jgi:hypothetical protein